MQCVRSRQRGRGHSVNSTIGSLLLPSATTTLWITTVMPVPRSSFPRSVFPQRSLRRAMIRLCRLKFLRPTGWPTRTASDYSPPIGVGMSASLPKPAATPTTAGSTGGSWRSSLLASEADLRTRSAATRSLDGLPAAGAVTLQGGAGGKRSPGSPSQQDRVACAVLAEELGRLASPRSCWSSLPPQSPGRLAAAKECLTAAGETARFQQ